MPDKNRSKIFDNVPEVKTPKKRKHTKTKKQLISTLKKTDEIRLYSELTPEDF